jgi:hypothetical protein
VGREERRKTSAPPPRPPVPSFQLYALLEDRVSRPGFEAALADARRTAAAGKPAPAADGAPPPPRRARSVVGAPAVR